MEEKEQKTVFQSAAVYPSTTREESDIPWVHNMFSMPKQIKVDTQLSFNVVGNNVSIALYYEGSKKV